MEPNAASVFEKLRCGGVTRPLGSMAWGPYYNDDRKRWIS
jgi:hypothetical protein